MERLIFVTTESLIIIISIFWLKNKIKAETKWQKYIRQHRVLHPNSITIARLFLAIVGCLMYFAGMQYSGIGLYIFSSFGDAMDGIIARECNLVSRWGKILDPLVDKIGYLIPIGILAHQGQLSASWVVAFAAIEASGQIVVRGIADHFGMSLSANMIGKIKATIAFMILPYIFLLEAQIVPDIREIVIVGCTILAFFSAGLKLIPRKHFSNILTAIHLLTGVVMLVLIFKKLFLAMSATAIVSLLVYFAKNKITDTCPQTTNTVQLTDWANWINFLINPLVFACSLLVRDIITTLAGGG